MVVPFEPEYNESLGYVLGVMVGDGHAFPDGITAGAKVYYPGGVTLRVKDRDFAETFAGALTKVLEPRKPYSVGSGRGKKWFYYRVGCGRGDFSLWIRSLTYQGIRDLLFSHQKMVKDFLRGFFDSEGHHIVGVRISACNTSVDLIILVADLLDVYFGIDATIGGYPKKSPSAFRVRVPKRYHKQFLREIGFSIKRKQRGIG